MLEPRLEPLFFAETVQPTLAFAELRHRFGRIRVEGGTSVQIIRPLSLADTFVQILEAIPPLGDDGSPAIEGTGVGQVHRWTGYISDPAMRYYKDVGSTATGDADTVQAYGIEHWLDQFFVRKSVLISGAGAEVTVERVPPMNLRSEVGGSLLGNMHSTMFCFTDDSPTTWSHYDQAWYLFNKFPPGAVVFKFTGDTSLAGLLQSTGQFYGWSFRQVLNALFSPRQGLTWKPMVKGPDDDVIYIQVCPTFADPIMLGTEVVQPMVPVVDLRDQFDEFAEEAQIRPVVSQRVDRLVVEGEPVRVVFSWSFPDLTAMSAWMDPEQAAFESAYTSPEAAEEKRFAHVFRKFRILPTWDFQAGDSEGGNLAPVNIGFNADGTRAAGVTSPIAIPFKRFLPSLPLLKGYDYSTDPPTAWDTGPRVPEFDEMMAWLRDTVTGGNNKYVRVDQPDPLFNDRGRVRPDAHELGARVEFRSPVAMAHGTWAGNDALTPLLTYDYRTLIFTSCMELDLRLQVVVNLPLAENSGSGRERVIHVPDAHYHWLCPYTVVGTDAGGTNLRKAPAAGMVLRDDSALLRRVAAFYKSWYLRPRNAIIFSRNRLEPIASPGTMIREFLGSHQAVAVNTIVTRQTFDLRNRRTTIETSYAEIDYSDVAADLPVPEDDLTIIERRRLELQRFSRLIAE